jgi:glycine/D-amino acid oxidase-like deaminating enzyme
VSDTAEVVVVGGGLEGCAAAWELTRRGVRDVLVCERSTVGSGGTGKSSGVVRCHYGVPSLAAMAHRSLALFEDAERLLGTDIGFQQTGYLVGVGPENTEALRANLARQRSVGVDTREIDRSEAARLWPWADLDDFGAFGWEPRGGHGDAYRTAQAFASAARRAGARVRQHCPVASVLARGGQACGVRLADGGRVDAGSVVVAAGPWSVPLLAEHDVQLPITSHREQIVMIEPGVRLGPVPVLSDLVSLQYVRAEGTALLFGNSDLATLEPADPDHYPNRADQAHLELAAGKLAHRFPRLSSASVSHSYAGCYDVTPDFNPVISDTPVVGLWVAAGFSGHGFKISPAVGALVADLVLHGRSLTPDIPASDFRLGRFAEDRPLRGEYPYAGAGQMR